jgi:hypothetical protein
MSRIWRLFILAVLCTAAFPLVASADGGEKADALLADAVITGTPNIYASGNVCIGSCFDGETYPSFGLKLKGTVDSSAHLTFQAASPARTWRQFVSTGAFVIRDDTGNASPFSLLSGAPSDSLVVQGGTGNVGLGTASPNAALEVADPAPKMRFNDSDSGQLWDIFPDTLSFDIIDATTTQTPFRIMTAAPSLSLFVDAAGKVGLGTSTFQADARLEVQSNAPALNVVYSHNANPAGAGVFRSK